MLEERAIQLAADGAQGAGVVEDGLGADAVAEEIHAIHLHFRANRQRKCTHAAERGINAGELACHGDIAGARHIDAE